MTPEQIQALGDQLHTEVDRRYLDIPAWMARKVTQYNGFVVVPRIVGDRLWAKIKDNDDYFSIPDDDLRERFRPLITATTPADMCLIDDDAPTGQGHLVLSPIH